MERYKWEKTGCRGLRATVSNRWRRSWRGRHHRDFSPENGGFFFWVGLGHLEARGRWAWLWNSPVAVGGCGICLSTVRWCAITIFLCGRRSRMGHNQERLCVRNVVGLLLAIVVLCYLGFYLRRSWPMALCWCVACVAVCGVAYGSFGFILYIFTSRRSGSGPSPGNRRMC